MNLKSAIKRLQFNTDKCKTIWSGSLLLQGRAQFYALLGGCVGVLSNVNIVDILRSLLLWYGFKSTADWIYFHAFVLSAPFLGDSAWWFLVGYGYVGRCRPTQCALFQNAPWYLMLALSTKPPKKWHHYVIVSDSLSRKNQVNTSPLLKVNQVPSYSVHSHACV